jgi:hypothetical protein
MLHCPENSAATQKESIHLLWQSQKLLFGEFNYWWVCCSIITARVIVP